MYIVYTARTVNDVVFLCMLQVQHAQFFQIFCLTRLEVIFLMILYLLDSAHSMASPAKKCAHAAACSMRNTFLYTPAKQANKYRKELRIMQHACNIQQVNNHEKYHVHIDKYFEKFINKLQRLTLLFETISIPCIFMCILYHILYFYSCSRHFSSLYH